MCIRDSHRCCHQSADYCGRFITLSVHICVQLIGLDAACRAGPSTAAETCFDSALAGAPCIVMSVSVWLSVRTNMQGTANPNFTKFSMRVAYGLAQSSVMAAL